TGLLVRSAAFVRSSRPADPQRAVTSVLRWEVRGRPRLCLRAAPVAGDRSGAVGHTGFRDRPGVIVTVSFVVDRTDAGEDALVLFTPEGEDRFEAGALDVDVDALARPQLVEQ